MTRLGFRLLASRQARGRPWYQLVEFDDGVTNEPWCGGRAGIARYRTETFLRFLDDYPIRDDDVVVDIGSNAALFSLVLSGRCRRVTAIEYDRRFHRQARFLAAQWNARGLEGGDAWLVNADITRHLELFEDATVVLASKVLYHQFLGDGVHELLDAIRVGPTRDILIQGHTPQGELGQIDGMHRLLADYGFDFRIAMEDPEYPIGVASRRGGADS